jgi:hypothetical protein
MASVVDSTAERVDDASKRNRWSLSGIARRPEFGAVVATPLVYLFFRHNDAGRGFRLNRRNRGLARHVR